jgi:hypothetical protein
VADDVEHLRDFGIVGADVAGDERIVVLELAQEGVFWDMAKDPSGKGTRTGTSRRSAVCGAPLCPFA